jgi:hypothetical protein
MQANRIQSALVSAALSFAISTALYSQQPPTSSSKPSPSPVHTIKLPDYSPEIANGPNVATFRKDCLICHTARYVSMQPRFSKAVWQSEVKKMVDVYGAPIPDADQALIVEYLVAVNGLQTSPDSSSPHK